eukprot:scaffold6404_cov36-Prasinocladus_malaysianus.AAC.2
MKASGPQPSSQLTIGVKIAALSYKYVRHGTTSDAVGRPLASAIKNVCRQGTASYAYACPPCPRASSLIPAQLAVLVEVRSKLRM